MRHCSGQYKSLFSWFYYLLNCFFFVRMLQQPAYADLLIPQEQRKQVLRYIEE